MNWTETIGRLLGFEDVSKIDSARVSFGSAWAQSSPMLVAMGCLVLAALSFVFYIRWQGQRATTLLLASLRAIAICLVFLILTDPTLEFIFVSQPKPVLWLLLDGSDSMSIPDEIPDDERKALEKAVDFGGYLSRNAAGRDPSAAASASNAEHPARADYARALLTRSNRNLLDRLSDQFRVRLFSFAESDEVRSLESESSSESGKPLERWKTSGAVTALGDAFEELSRKYAMDNLAGVLVISDFDQNSGSAPLAAAKKLGAPIFAVGVGPLTAVDLSVDMLIPPTMKRAELAAITVNIRQQELDHTSVHLRLQAFPSTETADASSTGILIGEKTLTLSSENTQLEFPYTPETTGRFVFRAEVDPIVGEVVTQNNQVEREIRIIDDFLRLMFVEYEPTWEWRFVKEVFHRDKLVGTRGFRTFIRSADPAVRETNELFLPTMSLPRSQFFENDVIFLGDMPTSALSSRFCEMTKEFVSQFGGGLVVMAGPRFGPGQLAETALAEMLPIVVDTDAKRRDEQEFRPTLTPIARQYDFMRLGQTDAENDKAWNNLGKLPWYQPVRRVEARGTQVLAEHPLDKCVDGKTSQPLIAIRQYGRGEVVYVGFNEMWRLRRLHGEQYYRQFWGQLIHRLGLSHALGSHKRFVVRTDRPQYRSGEEALITVEAYDKEFHPLDEKAIPDRKLMAEVVRPDRDLEGQRSQTIQIPQLKPSIFETRLPLYGGGEYRLKVTDPITNELVEINFDVANRSLERRNPVRNISLQKNLSVETGGKAYDLLDLDQFPEEFKPPRQKETSIEIIPLWNNWFVFAIVITLLMAEWFLRKLVNLA